jgi:hypothetical protein
MQPGDLVRLYDAHSDEKGEGFTVGNLDSSMMGWLVPQGTIAIVIKIVPDRGDGVTCHVLVDGKMGWLYEEECVIIDD